MIQDYNPLESKSYIIFSPTCDFRSPKSLVILYSFMFISGFFIVSNLWNVSMIRHYNPLHSKTCTFSVLYMISENRKYRNFILTSKYVSLRIWAMSVIIYIQLIITSVAILFYLLGETSKVWRNFTIPSQEESECLIYLHQTWNRILMGN